MRINISISFITLSLIVSLIHVNYSYSANTNKIAIDSLKNLLDIQESQSKIKTLCDLCWEYRMISEDSALYYGEQAMKIAIGINDSTGIAQAYNDLGIIHIDHSRYEKAELYFANALALRKALNDTVGQLASYNKLGIVFQKTGDYKSALKNQLNALQLAQALNNEPYLAHCYNNIGIIHLNISNYNKSLEYHNKALELRVKLNDNKGIAASYGNSANVYLKLGNYAKAQENYLLALKVSKAIGDMESVGMQLTNLGVLELQKGNYNNALTYHLEALDIRKQLGEKKYIASSLLKLGEVYIHMRRADKALVYLHEGLKMATTIQVDVEILQGYLNFSKAYIVKNNADSSMYYLDKYITLNDSVFAANIEQQLVDAQSRYESYKKDQDIELLKNQQVLNETLLKQKRTQVFLLLSIIVSILGAGFTFFYRRKQKYKQDILAERQKRTERMLDVIIQSQEAEREKVARELHDGLVQTLAAVKLSFESIKSSQTDATNADRFSKNLKHLEQACNEVRTISHQMLPKTLIELGVEKALRLLAETQFDGDEIACNYKAENPTNIRLAKNIELAFYRITQELFNNIIKHSEASVVHLTLQIRPEQAILYVKDNGRGFIYDQNKIGVGLTNIVTRAQQIGGFIKIESEPGKGTRLELKCNL